MTDIIAEANAALEGVTEGPWRVQQVRGYCIDYIVTDAPEFAPTPDKPNRNIVTETGLPDPNWEATGRFIAWCRAGVPALLARLEAAERVAEVAASTRKPPYASSKLMSLDNHIAAYDELKEKQDGK